MPQLSTYEDPQPEGLTDGPKQRRMELLNACDNLSRRRLRFREEGGGCSVWRTIRPTSIKQDPDYPNSWVIQGVDLESGFAVHIWWQTDENEGHICYFESMAEVA